MHQIDVAVVLVWYVKLFRLSTDDCYALPLLFYIASVAHHSIRLDFAQRESLSFIQLRSLETFASSHIDLGIFDL